MGCNSCKSKKNSLNVGDKVDIKKGDVGTRIVVFIAKSMLFIISLVIVTPMVIPFMVYTLYKTIFLNSGVDVTSGLVNLGSLLMRKNKDDDYDEEYDEDYNEEDLAMVGVEDITDSKK